MVLNPDLYRTLVKHFGDVKITHEGEQRLEERIPGKLKPHVIQRGEAYAVDCPFCGDERQRLSIGYKWLMVVPLTGKRVTHLARCYNEDCKGVRNEEFWGKFLPDIKAASLGLLDDIQITERTGAAKAQRGAIRMPVGCIPLHELPDTHPCIQFLLNHYTSFNTIRAVHYLSKVYGACFADEYDKDFWASQDRVIFPIYQGGKQIAWQGRTILSHVKSRWYLPPGFVKCFYNIDKVPPYMVPSLNEGITNAICCGPTGLCIFGKTLNSMQAEFLGSRFKSVILATDPETYVPDNRKGGMGRIYADETHETLSKYISDVRRLPWPKDILELATRHNNNEDVKVPDAADLGFKEMRRLQDKVT